MRPPTSSTGCIRRLRRPRPESRSTCRTTARGRPRLRRGVNPRQGIFESGEFQRHRPVTRLEHSGHEERLADAEPGDEIENGQRGKANCASEVEESAQVRRVASVHVSLSEPGNGRQTISACRHPRRRWGQYGDRARRSARRERPNWIPESSPRAAIVSTQAAAARVQARDQSRLSSPPPLPPKTETPSWPEPRSRRQSCPRGRRVFRGPSQGFCSPRTRRIT